MTLKITKPTGQKLVTKKPTGAKLTITGSQKVYTWNARDDLLNSLGGTKTNPNGVWSYGRSPSLTSTALTLVTASVSAGWQDIKGAANFGTPTFWVSAATVGIQSHPVIDISGFDPAVIRWTAPISCSVRIDSLVSKTEPAGDGVIYAVYKNTTELFTGTVFNGPTGTSSYVGNTTVIAGDFIDFKVARLATSTYDTFEFTRILLTGTI